MHQHQVGYAKHTSQNILLSVNLTHGKAFFQLTENFQQCLSSSYECFTSAWRFSLQSFSALRRTMTSSAGVFDVLAKYFSIFTAFRNRYSMNISLWQTASMEAIT